MPFNLSTEDRLIHLTIRQHRDGVTGEKNSPWREVATYRNYAKGKTGFQLTDKQKKILVNLAEGKFCDNICKTIIGEATGRITFEKWVCKNEPVKKWLDKFYAVTKVKNRQSDAHYRTLRDGNFAVSINWDKEADFVQWYKEDWWDGNAGTYIHYDEADKMAYVVKEWTYYKGLSLTSPGVKTTRRIIWFDDHLEKWESTNPNEAGSWTPANLESDEELVDNTGWKIPWLDEGGEPLGIPYVHFLNAVEMDGSNGTSELAGGVLGFQDQLLDAQYGMSMTLKLTGAQQYYGTGIKLHQNPNDPTKTLPIEVGPGMFHTSENPDSTFGVLPAGDISKQIEGYNIKLKAAARMTSTPIHTITGGDWPSGDALLRAEMPAVNKAHKQINQFADNWVTVATIALKIWNRFSDKEKLDYDIDKGIVECSFLDPERRDSVSRSIIVHNLSDKIGTREALRIMGRSDDDVQKIYEEKKEEDSEAAEALANQVLKGTVGNPKPKPKEAAGSGGNNKSGSRGE